MADDKKTLKVKLVRSVNGTRGVIRLLTHGDVPQPVPAGIVEELRKQLAGKPQATKDEIIKINTQARHIALQVALLVPILAGLGGLLISFRLMRLRDPKQSGSAEGTVLG